MGPRPEGDDHRPESAQTWPSMIATARGRLSGERAARPLGPVNPFEAWILAATAWYGALLLLGATRSTAIQRALPPEFRIAWAVILLAGGLLSLAGLLWLGNPFVAIEVKRFGLVAVGVASLAYAVALFSLGWDGAGIGGNYVCLTAACAIRVVQIRAALRRSVAYLKANGRRQAITGGG